MNMVWYTSFKLNEDLQHNNELLYCLNKNLENNQISRVVFIGEAALPVLHAKLEQIIVSKRPTFSDIFAFFKEGEINCLANGDIFANNTLCIAQKIKEKEFWGLSRYNLRGKKCKTHRFLWGDSQDCWIMKGKPRIEGNYFMGVLGCDNLLAYEAAVAGYQLRNYAYSLYIFHLHMSEERSYTEATRVGTSSTIERLYPECYYRLSIRVLRDVIVKLVVIKKQVGVFFPLFFLK